MYKVMWCERNEMRTETVLVAILAASELFNQCQPALAQKDKLPRISGAELLLDSAEFEVFITQRSPLNPNEYLSACIGRGFSSVWGPTWKTRKILEWPHGGRLRQPVLMAGELDSWSGASF